MEEKVLSGKIKNLLIDLIRGEDDIDNIQTHFEDLFKEEIKEAFNKGSQYILYQGVEVLNLEDYLKTKGL